MADFQEVFQRKEKKYCITSTQRAGLARILREHGYAVDSYGQTWISSMYYDTSRYDLICRSLEKPLYKEKLRIRSYEPDAFATPLQTVFVELKKKFKGVVYKRRINVTLEQAQALLSGSLSPNDLNVQRPLNAQEIAQCAQRYGQLSPAITIRCLREAWALAEPDAAVADAASQYGAGALSQPGVRITFDSQLQARDERALPQGMRSAGVQHGEWWRIMDADQSILEIKAYGAYPLWLAEALSELDIRPCSFSKYGTAFQQMNYMKEGIRYA